MSLSHNIFFYFYSKHGMFFVLNIYIIINQTKYANIYIKLSTINNFFFFSIIDYLAPLLPIPSVSSTPLYYMHGLGPH